MTSATIHATAVRVGDRAVLIRGPSGAGKSRLAFDLILAGRSGQLPPTVLVGDDRVHLDVRDGQLTVRPAPDLAGLIEIYGLGIRSWDFAEEAVVGLVVDLAAADAARMPTPEATIIDIKGIKTPRLPVKAGHSALGLVAAALITVPAAAFSANCRKGIRNHMRHSIATE